MTARRAARALAWPVIALSLAVACSRNPNITYARLLERAASWASAVVFTTELAREQKVPQPFVYDVMTTAGKELRQIQSDIAAHDDVAESARNESTGWCRRLGALVEDAAHSRNLTEAGEVRDIERRLRTAAREARAGASESPR